MCSNAIKFTHEGSVTINVKVTEAPKPIESATQNALFDADEAAAILHPEISAESDPCILRSNSLPLFPIDDHQVLGSSGDGIEGVTELSTQQSAVPIAQEDLDSDCLGLLDEVWLHCEICDTGIGIPGKQWGQFCLLSFLNQYKVNPQLGSWYFVGKGKSSPLTL
jgi:signal transduction histidine kinase